MDKEIIHIISNYPTVNITPPPKIIEEEKPDPLEMTIRPGRTKIPQHHKELKDPK